ncbi:Lrp/AsnC family transcriptional regulator [uncultured Ruegeria sp.]|uniref:Lrp/AsnC family transcriptional regulator n=1 Tax=uncultured Ruegeria sp. TaxID=259304 RepID=UPI00262869C0|nr:Lrp/AsnC family transcriptional regulator [uncultured Ruegeria sp.]
MSVKHDDIDRDIIRYLSQDGRASASEIAQKIGKVTERTIRNRIASLLQSRQIVISAIPDPSIDDPGIHAEVMIDVDPGRIDEVAARLGEFDQVGFLAATTGENSLSASVFAADNASLFDFTEKRMAKTEGVRRVDVRIVLRFYKVFGTRTTALSKSSEAGASVKGTE